MLQPDKSAKRTIAESYNRQFEELTPVDQFLLKKKIEHSDREVQLPFVYSQDQLDLFKDRGLASGRYKDMDKLLGQSQEGFERGLSVIARGLAKAPSAFLEPIGYGVDYISNNVFGEVAEGEEDFKNSFNELLKKYEEGVDEMFPVYTGDIEAEPSVFQSGWWVKNGDQIIRSLGYYPYGMVAGRVLGAGVSGLLTRGAATNASVKTSTELAKQALNIERTSRGFSAIATGVTQNYSEHMHSAGSVFAENYKEYKEIFRELDPESTDAEIDKRARIKAGHDASNVVKMGRWNLLFEIPTNYMLFRSPATTRSLQGIAGEGRKATMQRLGMVAFEPTQEAGEEIWTGFLEKEAKRQVGIEKGYYDNDYTTMFDRWSNHALSYEGYTEGLSGAIGGGIFTGYSLAFADSKARKVQLEQEKVNASFANDMSKYRNLNEESLFETFRSNAQKGTYESMIKHFEDIRNLSAEQAKDRGLDPDYKEKASKAIDKALAYEQDYNANIFTYKNPIKAEILTRSKYVQNFLQETLQEAEGKLGTAQSEVTNYLDAKGISQLASPVFGLTAKTEATRATIDRLKQEYQEINNDVKNNKNRTLDTGETGADILQRIEFLEDQLKTIDKERQAAVVDLYNAEDITIDDITSFITEAFRPGNPLYNLATAEQEVLESKSRYATEVDRYTDFINNPSKLNKEVNNITGRAKKVEKARKDNIKKQKAEERAEKEKSNVNAKKEQASSNKVEGEGSTAENINTKEESDGALDEILATRDEAPPEVILEAETPSIDDEVDKVIAQANVESMEAYQAMLEGQLSEEQQAKLQSAIEQKKTNKEKAKKNKTEQTANTAEVARAAANDKSIGESVDGDREIKNFNYDKNKDGSIPFERQDSATEEQDKKQLTKETAKSLPNQPDSRIGIRTKQIIDGANALAYLAVEYESQIIDTPKGPIFVRRTASKDKTASLVPEVESPNHLQPGTNLTLRTVKEGSKGLRYIYDATGMPKEVSWKYSDFVKPSVGAIPAEINSEQIPIEIVAEVQGQEKVIGYLHDTDWVDAALSTGQPRNIVENPDMPDNWNFQKNEIRALRENIINKGGEVTTTIKSVGEGTPFLNVVLTEDGKPTGKTEWADVKSLMPGWENIDIAFRKVGSWRTNSTDVTKDFIVNDKDYSDGRIGLILPTKQKGKSFVAPLWTKPLNNTQIDTIINASLALEDTNLSKQITDSLGFNFSKSNPAALHTLINKIVYTNSFEFDSEKSGDTVFFDVNPKTNTIMIANNRDRVIYTNKPNAVPESLKKTAGKVVNITEAVPQVRKILQTVLPSLNINKANAPEGHVDPIIEAGAEGLVYNGKKYNTYKEYALELVQTNINGTNSFTGANGQQEYVYINQPVIQFSKDFEGVSKPKPVAKKESVKPDQVINIYAGANENTELSNFAERPVTYGTEKFRTVEGAFQAMKVDYANKSKKNDSIIDKLLTATGAEAKRLGRQIEGLNQSVWDKDSPGIMKGLIKDSFEQNPDALQKLLDTGNATLTHTQDKSRWGKLFPEILMEVREELREKDSKKPNQLFGGLIEEADYDNNFSISFDESMQPQLPFEKAEIQASLDNKMINRLDPLFIDFSSIDYPRQKEILKFTSYHVTKQFTDNPTIGVEESLDRTRQIFINAKNDPAFEQTPEIVQKDINTILAKWEKVSELTKEQLASVQNIKEGKRNTKKDLEKTDFTDEGRWQSNPKKKASERLKVKMSQILKRQRDGVTPELNYLGLPTFYTFDEVWDGLKGVLSESLPNINAMLEVLNKKSSINPMYGEVAKYINSKLTEQEKSEFVSEFANAYISQRITMFSKDRDGNFKGEIIDSAANKESNLIKERWLTEQLQNENLVKYTKDGEAYIDVKYVRSVEDNYRKRFKEISDKYKISEGRNSSDEMIELVQDTMTKLSITVPPEAIKYLSTPIEGTNQALGDDILGQAWGYTIDPRSPKGLISLIFKSYKTDAPKLEDIKFDPEVQENAKALYQNNPLKGKNFQGIILKLAETTSQFGDPRYVISYRDGEGKAVYPYNGTTSMHVLLKLYENYENDDIAKSLVDNIMSTHMGSASRMLPKIIKNKGAFKVLYADALKDKFSSERSAAKRKNQGILQQDINSSWLFQNSNKNKGFFFGITKADRGVSELIEHDKINFKDQVQVQEGKAVKLFKTAEDYLYSYVQGEIKRIYKTQSELDSNPEFLQGTKYREGSQYFHFFPFLNKHELEKVLTKEEVDTVYPSESFDGAPRLNITAAEPILRKALNNWTVGIINETMAEWESLGIVEKNKTKLDSSYMASLGKEGNVKDRAVMAAADLELNTIVSNIEQQILFGGDIAEAYNGKGSTVEQKIESGRSNNQKRLIGSDAPKVQGNYDKREYTAVTFSDRLSFSENYEYYDKLFGTDSPYGSPTNKAIESTDALEMTTVQEHIDMLKFFGQISPEMYESISNKIDAAIKDESNTKNYYALTEAEMAFALKPVKPQYDFMHPDAKTGRLSRVYRKSMSIPLLPDMTSDFQLDNVRIAMENTGVARTGHKTSDKLSPFKVMSAYDSDGNVKSVEELTEGMKSSKFTLNRDGLGIQQEKNVKPSQRVSDPTQKGKLTFQGLLEEKFTYDGKEITGKQLRDLKQERMTAIYKLKHDALLEKYGNIKSEDGIATRGDQVKMATFVAALKEEAKARNWNINDIFSLDLKEDGTETIVPLPFIQSRKMLEGLMLSIVNKTVNVKIPGITFVQSSSAGFKSTAAWSNIEGTMRNQVITTTGFDESKGLQGPRWDEAKGEVVPGQVMVKFFYKDQEGNELDIQAKDDKGNYIFLFEKNGRLFLNPNKVPKEIRNIIGFRIPYQNLGSEMPLEIVGFLPKNMELTAIVPDEILPQMGSDFDVDTLNTLIAQYIVTKNKEGAVKGVFRKDRKKYADNFTKEDLLLDELRDMYWSVLTTNKAAYDKMSKGIDDPALENIADEVDSILNKNTRTRTPIARIDQIKDNISQRQGQVLIGPGAQANTFNAIIEDMNVEIVQEGKRFNIKGLYSEQKLAGKKKGQFRPINFSDLSAENRTLYYKKGNKFYRTSSDVINIFLNAAIDNANKPTLGKLNMTMDTLPTALFMAMGGVNIENIGYMIPQEIMREYTRELEKIVPGLSDKNVFDRKRIAYETVQKKYQELGDVANVKELEALVEEYTDEKNEDFEMLFQSNTLKEQLEIGAPNSGIEKTKDYYKKQLVLLEKFKEFERYADKLNKTRKAVNDPSVNGLGSTVAAAKNRLKQLKTINPDAVYAPVKDGISGLSSLAKTEYGNVGKYLKSAFTLFSNAYPADTLFLESLEDAYVTHTESDTISDNVMETLFNSVIANGWSYAINEVFVKENKEASSLYELRRKLFIEENNIAVQTSKAQKADWGKTNEFVTALKPVFSTNKNKGKASVTIDWSSNLDNLAMQRGFTSLFLGTEEMQEFGKNLVIAAYLNGGTQKATSYLSMIPFGALEKLGLHKHLNNNMFQSEDITNIQTYLTQIMQHNPWLATQIDPKEKSKTLGEHFIARVDENSKQTIGLLVPELIKAKDVPSLNKVLYTSDGDIHHKHFLSYPVGNTYFLFVKDNEVIENGVAKMHYKRVDLKGDKFGTEYDFSGNTFSYLEANKVIKTVKDPMPSQVPPIGIPMHEVPVPEAQGFNVPGDVPINILEDYENRKDNADNELDALLDTIINNGKEGTAELARLLKTKGIYKSVPFKGVEYLEKVQMTTGGKYALGRYNSGTNKIQIFQGSLDAAKATDSFVAETMLHETVHYFTVAAINGTDTSAQAKRFKLAMDSMRQKALQIFETNEQYQQGRTTREKNRNARIKYALSNSKEFIAGATESAVVQEFLNNIPHVKEGNLFNKLKNLIKNYFLTIGKQLGFDVKPGSLLDVSLSEMLLFLQVQDDMVAETLVQELQRTPKNDVGGLDGIIGGATPVLDANGNPTGEVIVNGPLETPADKQQQFNEALKNEEKEKIAEEVEETEDDPTAIEKTEEEFPNSDREILAARKEPINYTKDQEKALLIASDFINQEEEVEMLLAGYAGTGKTTIIENIIRYAESIGKSVVVTSPTNKATLVIGQKLKKVGINKNRESGLTTNHGFLTGEPDRESGRFELDPKRFDEMDLENTIHIMDEASMLAGSMLSNLQWVQTLGLKTIYIGDGFQLPPVLDKTDKDPEIFKREYKHKVEMTEVKRQAENNPVLTVATNMRNTGKAIIPLESVPEFEVSRNAITSQKAWLDDLKAGKNVIKIVAKNPDRISANKAARRELFGPNADVIEDGDVLIAVANSGNLEEYTNEFGDISRDVANSEILGVNRDKVYTKHPKNPELTTIYTGTGQYPKPVKAQALLDESGNTIILLTDGYGASIPHQTFTAGMFGSTAIRDIEKREANENYFRSLDLIIEVEKKGEKEPAVAKRAILAYYGYAITAHKSQGSQWEKAYINHWKHPSTGPKEAARWLYTAITRAEKSVVVDKQIHHEQFSLAAITNAVNNQLGSPDSKKVATPQDVITFDAVLNQAIEALPSYRELLNVNGREKLLEGMKKMHEGDPQKFYNDVQRLIAEAGGDNYSIVSDSMDMPVNAHGEIAEVVQSLNGRIKALQRRKTLATSVEKGIYLGSQIEALKADIEKLKEGNNTFVIEDVALRQLDWAKNVLDRPKLSVQEMVDASRLLDVWSFKNTKNLLSEAQAEDKDNPTRKMFAEVGSVADDIALTLSAKSKDWIKTFIEQQTGQPLTDSSMSAFLSMEDEQWFRGKFIDAAGFSNPIARAADGAMKTVARNAEDATLNIVTEIQKKFRELNKELNALGLETDIFLQKDKDGNPTGYFASKFSETYYTDLQKTHARHKKELERIIGSTRLTGDQIREQRYESFRDLYATKNSMEIVIDTRFWTEEGHTASGLNSKEQYINYLKNEFGETLASDLIGQTDDSIARYNLEETAHRRKVAADLSEGVIKPAIGLTLQETAASIHKQWVNKNNPTYYLDQRYNTTRTNIAYGTSGYKYTVAYPRPTRSEYFNQDFAKIENSEVLSDFYTFWSDKMAEFKSYLPEVAVHEMSQNFFPTIQKDLLEEYTNRGAIAALSYLSKDTKLYGALFADETLGLSRENEGLKSELDERGVPVSKVPLRFLGSENIELEDRAFDLERVMVMFAGMSMNYKFKAEAEPLITLLMRTVREATKPYLDSRGKQVKRWGSNKNVTIKSGPQLIQESLDYAEQAIMYGKSREQVSKTGLELPGNFSKDIGARYRKSKELKEEYNKLNDDLVDGKITQAEFNSKAEKLESEFKELGIKAFSFNKMIRGFISYTQLKGLGWNLSAGIANVGFGMLASSIHAAGEEDYTSKELGKALRIVIASAVNPSSTKAAAIMKRMNLLFEMREITYGKGDVRGKKSFNMLGKLNPMYIQQSTEFVVQGMSAVAKMLNTVVVDKQGNSRNLYEAFNNDGTWNVNEFGYQKEWDFNNLGATTRNSYTKFRDAAIEMNKKLHGNYDPNSLVQIKSKDFNLLFTIFRTWAFEGFNTRYSKKVWNDQLGRETKGRYNSLWTVGLRNSSKIMMKLLLRRVTRQSTDQIMSGIEDNIDAVNLKKTFAAMKAQATILALGIMLKGLSDGTDDDEVFASPALKATLNILYRVEQDLSYYRNPVTFIDIFKDPTPALKTVNDFIRAVDGTERYILKEDYRGDHPIYKWGKVFPLTNQAYKWMIITEKDLDTSYGLSNYIEDEYFKDKD